MNYRDDQPALFTVDTPPVKTPRRPRGAGHVTWSRYRVKSPVKCDDCMLVLAVANGEGPASRRAQYRRTQDGSDLLLCAAHAQIRRDQDDLNEGAFSETDRQEG